MAADSSAPAASSDDGSAEAARGQAQAGTFDLITTWGAAYGQRLRAAMRLVLAEARLAVTSFILMVVAVILAAFAVMFAWALLLYAGMKSLALVGAPLILTAIGLALAHLLLAALLWRMASKLGQHLDFEATREMLEKDT